MKEGNIGLSVFQAHDNDRPRSKVKSWEIIDWLKW
jgi:hypothetical protein